MPITRRAALCSLSLAALVLATARGADAQLLGNRPFLTSPNNKLSATFSGARCGEAVSFVFTGPDRGAFSEAGVAPRLMNNVVASLRATCPRVKLVAAKGVAAGDVVYNAVAESDTGWKLLELGSSRDASMLGGGARGTSADRANFARRADFAGFGAVLAATRGKPYLCSGLQGNTCTASSEFRGGTDEGATVVARSLLDGGGTEAVLTYAARNRGGFLCSNPQQAAIEVVGGTASAAARTRMATDLRERLKPYGEQVCSGYALRGARIISANFDSNGARVGQEGLLVTLSRQPGLRQDK